MVQRVALEAMRKPVAPSKPAREPSERGATKTRRLFLAVILDEAGKPCRDDEGAEIVRRFATAHEGEEWGVRRLVETPGAALVRVTCDLNSNLKFELNRDLAFRRHARRTGGNVACRDTSVRSGAWTPKAAQTRVSFSRG